MTKEEIVKLRETWESIYKLITEIFNYEEIKNKKNNFLEEITIIFKDWLNNSSNNHTYGEIIKCWAEMLLFFNEDKNKAFNLMEIKRLKYSNKPLEITNYMGVVVRQIAKLCRLENMIKNNLTDQDETLIDTKVDLANYALIGLEMAVKNGINITDILIDSKD